MQASLAITALLMGLAGGPHCIAMCGAACAGIGQAAGARQQSAMWTFQLGRVLGYSALGALAAASMQGLGWLTVQSAALRPVWTLFHVATLILGLVLLLKAQQPVWLGSGSTIFIHNVPYRRVLRVFHSSAVWPMLGPFAPFPVPQQRPPTFPWPVPEPPEWR